MNGHAPQPVLAESTAESTSVQPKMLLEAAAGLLDRRVVAIRSGTAPLHAALELELAARAIRSLAAEWSRLHEPGEEGAGGSLPSTALRGPPVLKRTSRSTH